MPWLHSGSLLARLLPAMRPKVALLALCMLLTGAQMLGMRRRLCIPAIHALLPCC